LVGLAPFDDDSGRWRGGRRVAGGRGAVRAKLFLAARAAARRNPVRSACNQIVNAVVRSGQPWNPELAAAR
jgi:transposase